MEYKQQPCRFCLTSPVEWLGPGSLREPGGLPFRYNVGTSAGLKNALRLPLPFNVLKQVVANIHREGLVGAGRFSAGELCEIHR